MRPRSLLVAVGVLAVFLDFCGIPVPAFAQTETALEVTDVDSDTPPFVNLTVTAPRELVGEKLTADHFTVHEAGVERPAAVRKLPNDSLEVVLVIDTSGSMQGDPIAAAQEAAVGFVEEMPAGTRISIVGFGDAPEVASPFTTDRDDLVAAIAGLEATGETALYDAIAVGQEALAGTGDPNTREFLVVLSDGGDSVSTRTLDETVAGLAGADLGFFAVALATSDSDLGALAQLSQASDGKVAAASDPSEIVRVYDAIASQLVNQYELRYRAGAEGETALQVRLEAAGVTAGWEETVELPALPEPAALPQPVAPDPYTAPEAPWYAQGWLLLAGAVPFGLAFLIGAAMFLSARRTQQLAHQLKTADPAKRTAAIVEGASARATAFAEDALGRYERLRPLNTALERAGLTVRPAEYIVLTGVVAIAATVVSLLVLGPVMMLVTPAVVLFGSWQMLTVMRKQRQRKLADQLGDTLQLLAGSLRSGHGLIQALDMVTREAESPTAEEFHRVIVEARLGRDLSEALDALAERAENEDFEWVVQAMRIHREVGGDLAEILDGVGETIRDRNRVRGQIRALTAEGRLSAILLMALPFLVGGWMWIANPDYISELFVRPAGRIILAFGAALMTIGAFVMKRLVKPEF